MLHYGSETKRPPNHRFWPLAFCLLNLNPIASKSAGSSPPSSPRSPMEDFVWLGRGGGGGANGGVIFRSTSSLHLQRRPRGGGRVRWNFPIFLVRATAGRFVAPPMLEDATPDTAARQIADPPYNWGYSKPVVILDVVWNSLFVLVSAAVLLWASRERPETPIRAWVLGYAVQCLLHVGFVCCEYSRRLRMRERRSRWVGLVEEEEAEFEADQEESRFVCITKFNHFSWRVESFYFLFFFLVFYSCNLKIVFWI